ncbi:MAG TPA: hypothetical protein VM509_06065 [Planctomycetota bacterium]|nr:hypothetical protein [Planctomycetota bacterium]
MKIPDATLLAIQAHFHAVLRGRAAELIEEHALQLPQLESLLAVEDHKAWFPVLGMMGGFSYWLEGDGPDANLVCESWSRVVEGSGQRHEITATGSRLVGEGFV